MQDILIDRSMSSVKDITLVNKPSLFYLVYSSYHTCLHLGKWYVESTAPILDTVFVE